MSDPRTGDGDGGGDGKQSFPAPELREYALGTLNVDHRHVHRHAGLLRNPEAEQMLTRAAESYEPLNEHAPLSFWDTEFARDCIMTAGTATATNALHNGDDATLSYISGLVGYKSDASGLLSLSKMQRLIERTPVFIGYIFGLMGSGKTDFALVLAQIFYSVYGKQNVKLATNFDCNGQDEQILRYSRLIEVLEERRETAQNGGNGDEFIMILDEAAQEFTGSGKDQQKAKHLAKLLKLARKSESHILMIGQDGKDIGPSLRALCTVFVEKKKTGEKQYNAAFWQDVKNREGIGKILSLSTVPPTDIPFGTYDEGRFTFDVDDDDDAGKSDEEWQRELDELADKHEKKMMAVLAAHTDKTNTEIAEVYGYSSATTVTNAKKKYGAELEEMQIAEFN